MPTIFDNIDVRLLPNLQAAANASYRGDFCVGYFNLRGWKSLADAVDAWQGGEGHCARVLVGMQRLPQEELRRLYSLQASNESEEPDQRTILQLKKKMALEFRTQLTQGIPTNADEAALRQLIEQLRSRKVVVKLFTAYPLHAKLYLLYRQDRFTPVLGYLGSSNLTMSGLSNQGELNVDVMDSDAAQKLTRWFDDRWEQWGSQDISNELIEVIEESWARPQLLSPHTIYVKMAYHLSQEARSGLSQFQIPKDFQGRLFDFQVAAVKIAAHHLNRRGGVLIGDVVGLGKTLMATALARIFEDDQDLETLIICPKNLVSMWESYRDQYRLRGKVLSISRVSQDLPNLRRYRLVILDESHNLRNREGKRYKIIQEYIAKNESKVILLSATPYNKTYLDLSNQLRLFISEDQELPIRPENLLRMMGETSFFHQYACSSRSLAAFEKSNQPDDWRELMRLYMVRRTRSFILQNYASLDLETGRRFLPANDGTGKRFFFPARQPRTVRLEMSPQDPYTRMYDDDTVDTIDSLHLPRYGLGNYLHPRPPQPPSGDEKKTIQDLSRAGPQLMGFCRTNLFKRLESSGAVFLTSIERHILRNYIYLHALQNNLPVPIGTQDMLLLDTAHNDEDVEQPGFIDDPLEDERADEMLLEQPQHTASEPLRTADDFARRAAQVYAQYAGPLKRRFKWLNAHLFQPKLAKDLAKDVNNLMGILQRCGTWQWQTDVKFQALLELVTKTYPEQKILIFTQFADTVRYLESSLAANGVQKMSAAFGQSANPTELARRFSPVSNEAHLTEDQELRILIATDVLSEGQNLQDAFIVINYDLPWAIVRLIQRAGRVDRIGQMAETIFCYSFLPAEGVERIIRLRSRVRQRLKENGEVLGTDETFFEDDDTTRLVDLYNEKAGILDEEEDGEVDLASYAYQIWKNAITRSPGLQHSIPKLPGVVFSSRQHIPFPHHPGGALVYVRTRQGNDVLAWVDEEGKNVTQSQFEILRAAECAEDEPALPHSEQHHQWVQCAVQQVLEEEHQQGGNLGKRSSARFRVYERMKKFILENKHTLFVNADLEKAVDELYQHPLRESAKDLLNRQLRSGIEDIALAELLVNLRAEDRLCVSDALEAEQAEPEIICSLGLIPGESHVK